MKLKAGLGLLLLLVFSAGVYAQDAAETVEKLRAQLLDVQMQEDGLRGRLDQLNEAIKPENIERSLAGVGSTRPEELREHRRRQLAIERDGVQAQLKTLETSRQRLESAIANAEQKADQLNVTVDVDRLFISTAMVDLGPTKYRRRVRPAPMGRAYRERRWNSHITIEVETGKE